MSYSSLSAITVLSVLNCVHSVIIANEMQHFKDLYYIFPHPLRIFEGCPFSA